MLQTDLPSNETAILSRVIRPGHNDLSASAARALLKLHFAKEDHEEMHELAVKNQAGILTAAEKLRLDGFLRVGRLLDLLAAKARLSLKK